MAGAFRAGDIDYRLLQTLVFRTDLITDPQVLARVDGELAVRVARWPSMTHGRLAGEIDRVVAKADPDAVRARRVAVRDREVWIGESQSGMGEVAARLCWPDAAALDKRLDALAATVCDGDPRTRDQRRADALGVLAAGGDRLGCQCGGSTCPGSGRPAGPVVIHVVAEQSTLEGRSDAPGSLLGADSVVGAEVLAEVAKSAKRRPLTAPSEAEPHYVPSANLATFVRARDLTCRAPGCDRPATDCDLDHTVPYADGGATHPSNLKCLCRTHHLLKTFWGWRDKQLPDGTVVWTAPSGQIYVTTPGSAVLFPALCAPTGEFPRLVVTPGVRCEGREAMMPTRTRTRAQNRADRINGERAHNCRKRHAALAARPATATDPDPPPF